MSEPQAGSALTDLTTRAETRGDKVILNGTKRWCSGGGHADGYVVYCRMSEDEGARGIGAVYVEKDTKGVTFGKPEEPDGLSWRTLLRHFLRQCRRCPPTTSSCPRAASRS